MRNYALVLILALATATPAFARDKAPQTPVAPGEKKARGKLQWTRQPTPREVLYVYPQEALRAGEQSTVVMHCASSPLGLLENCKVVQAAQGDEAFAAAALRLSHLYRLRVDKRVNPRRPTMVQVPVDFRLAPQ